MGRIQDEPFARAVAQTGPTCNSPGTERGGFNQAQGDAQTHPNDSIYEAPDRDRHHPNGTRRAKVIVQVGQSALGPLRSDQFANLGQLLFNLDQLRGALLLNEV